MSADFKSTAIVLSSKDILLLLNLLIGFLIIISFSCVEIGCNGGNIIQQNAYNTDVKSPVGQ